MHTSTCNVRFYNYKGKLGVIRDIDGVEDDTGMGSTKSSGLSHDPEDEEPVVGGRDTGLPVCSESTTDVSNCCTFCDDNTTLAPDDGSVVSTLLQSNFKLRVVGRSIRIQL